MAKEKKRDWKTNNCRQNTTKQTVNWVTPTQINLG